MLAFARNEFALMENVDGCTQREHNENYFEQTRLAEGVGRYPKGWTLVECPREARYLWDMWLSMHGRRTSNGFGPNPIPDQGVIAWQERRGIRLSRLEHAAIDGIETMFFLTRPKANK